MVYFLLRFWVCEGAPQKISFYRTELQSSLQLKDVWVNGIFCIPIVKRPSSFAFRASTSPDAVLARRPQTQKPYSRAVLLLVCLCYQTFCPRYHILFCCYKLSNYSKLCLGLSGLFSRDQYILRMSHLRFHGIVYTPAQFWHTLYYNTVSTPICIYPFSICKSNSLTTRVTRQNVAK